MNIIDRLLEHNLWATRELIESARPLSTKQWTQQFEIGMGNLHDTILHIIGAMQRWTDRMQSRPMRPRVEDEKGTKSPDELIQLLDHVAKELGSVCRALKDDRRINDMMTIDSTRHEKKLEFTYGTAIVHVTTHGMHHRAQCLNMLRRLGVKNLPDLDAIEWELQALIEK